MSGIITRLPILTALALCTPLLSAQRPSTSSGPHQEIKVEHFGERTNLPLLIVLHGVSGPSDFYRDQAAFFAAHGYRVDLPHYLEAGKGVEGTDTNYEAWVAAVRKFLIQEHQQSATPVVIVGYSLGASVALALGSQGEGPVSIAEFYGSLPDKYFLSLKGMPPLLILHGGRDNNIPVSNALQLSRLCSQADLKCDMHIYPDEEHGFASDALRDADQRTLKFFAQALRTPAEK